MEHVLNVSISLSDLKILIHDLVGEELLEYFDKGGRERNELLTYAQVFETFYIKPEKLIEWKELGLINEYPIGKKVKFKISELFKAVEALATIRKKEIAAEIQKEVQP